MVPLERNRAATSDQVLIQRSYYKNSADRYDSMHGGGSEHDLALTFMSAAIKYLDVESVLDVGSGTGRTLEHIKKLHPGVRSCGVEPSEELRSIGYQKGLDSNALIDGDAQALAFSDGEFDLVCAFAALHHIPDPHKAVREMLRVARKAIFISDANNFGQGRLLTRTAKQFLAALGLWNFADFVKTGGRGYTLSEGDGLAYSYSVFSDYREISNQCRSVHIMNTGPAGRNIYRSAAHVAVLGVK